MLSFSCDFQITTCNCIIISNVSEHIYFYTLILPSHRVYYFIHLFYGDKYYTRNLS